MVGSEYQHPHPAWRQKADFAIFVPVNDETWRTKWSTEQLAARKIGKDRFEICCIPALVYDLHIGDVVKVNEEYQAVSIVKNSDFVCYRIANMQDPHAVKAQLVDLFRSHEIYLELLPPSMLGLAVKIKHSAEIYLILNNFCKRYEYEIEATST